MFKKKKYNKAKGITVDVDIFAQYIFSLISHSAVHARKFDVNDKLEYHWTNIINSKMLENLMLQKYPRRLNHKMCENLHVRKYLRLQYQNYSTG